MPKCSLMRSSASERLRSRKQNKFLVSGLEFRFNPRSKARNSQSQKRWRAHGDKHISEEEVAESDINVWPSVLHCCFSPRSSRKNPHDLLFSRSWSLLGDLGGQRGAAVREKWARRRAGSYPQQRAHASGNLGGRKSYCRERRTGFHQRAPCRWRCRGDRRERKHSNLLFCDGPRFEAP